MKLLSKAMQKIPRLSLPLTNYQFKSRQFIQTFHPTIFQHQRYTRINRPIGPFRRHETPNPLLPPDIFKSEGFNQNPEELFQPLFKTPGTPTSLLLHHINDFAKTLIYIDGASIGNGTPDARAGYGVYRSPNKSLNICRPLPIGTTNNRAELWAAVSALELIAREPTATDSATSPPPRSDGGSGSGAVVDTWIIASDSTYIVTGATDWAWKRRAAGWKKSKNAPEVEEMELSEELALGEGLIPNADLWDRLLRGIMNIRGQILFWLIERKWNQADGLASMGAKLGLSLDIGGGWGRALCSDDFRKAWSASRLLCGPETPVAPAPTSASPRLPLPPPAELEEDKKEDITTPPSDNENVPHPFPPTKQWTIA